MDGERLSPKRIKVQADAGDIHITSFWLQDAGSTKMFVWCSRSCCLYMATKVRYIPYFLYFCIAVPVIPLPAFGYWWWIRFFISLTKVQLSTDFTSFFFDYTLISNFPHKIFQRTLAFIHFPFPGASSRKSVFSSSLFYSSINQLLLSPNSIPVWVESACG